MTVVEELAAAASLTSLRRWIWRPWGCIQLRGRALSPQARPTLRRWTRSAPSRCLSAPVHRPSRWAVAAAPFTVPASS